MCEENVNYGNIMNFGLPWILIIANSFEEQTLLLMNNEDKAGCFAPMQVFVNCFTSFHKQLAMTFESKFSAIVH